MKVTSKFTRSDNTSKPPFESGLYRARSTGNIVFMLHPETGTVVYSNTPRACPIGYWSDSWNMNAFERVHGAVEITA